MLLLLLLAVCWRLLHCCCCCCCSFFLLLGKCCFASECADIRSVYGLDPVYVFQPQLYCTLLGFLTLYLRAPDTYQAFANHMQQQLP